MAPHQVTDSRDVRSFNAFRENFVPDPFPVFLEVHQELAASDAEAGLAIDLMREV
jgi:hypothetical protein